MTICQLNEFKALSKRISFLFLVRHWKTARQICVLWIIVKSKKLSSPRLPVKAFSAFHLSILETSCLQWTRSLNGANRLCQSSFRFWKKCLSELIKFVFYFSSSLKLAIHFSFLCRVFYLKDSKYNHHLLVTEMY